jgi:hypothetical protein
MRYLLLTYYKKPNGQIDEVMAVAKNLKTRDHQTANVILDFKTLSVVKCSMVGTVVPRDWDRIVTYYHQYYENIIERLLQENGYEIVKSEEPKAEVQSQTVDPS